MDDLQTILDNLDAVAESYVLESAKDLHAPIETVLKKIGVSKSKFYKDYDAESRAFLDDVARAINRNTNFRALKEASDRSVTAMNKLSDLMRSAKSEYVQYQAAMGLLAYALGTPTQHHEAKVEITDWRREVEDAGLDASSLFNKLVEVIADQSAGDGGDDR